MGNAKFKRYLGELARGKNVFSQSAHLFTKILTNQISEKTIDFAGEAAQKRPKWRKFGEAV